jgi:hypothetical protein
VVDRGELAIRGVAWSGAAPMAGVEVKLDDGDWQAASLLGEPARHSWQRWELLTRVDRTGACVIQARGSDMAGRIQPELPEWNRLGYGNNAVQRVRIEVR